MTTSVALAAPAKLTLSLRIVGVRADGYHLIDAEMVTLAWGDELQVTEGSDGLTADGPFAAGMPLDDTNLVARALKLSGRRASVHISKQVPQGGGLGGGSADAAAVLRWAGYDDLAGAAGLGADVPFCLVGGRARVRGIGEIVEPLPFVPLDITLVIPPIAVSTPAVYRAWDELGGPSSDEQVNDLEAAAITVVPELARWRDRIHEAAGTRPTLAGSGATWFLPGRVTALGEALPEAMVVQTRTDRPPANGGGRSERDREREREED